MPMQRSQSNLRPTPRRPVSTAPLATAPHGMVGGLATPVSWAPPPVSPLSGTTSPGIPTQWPTGGGGASGSLSAPAPSAPAIPAAAQPQQLQWPQQAQLQPQPQQVLPPSTGVNGVLSYTPVATVNFCGSFVPPTTGSFVPPPAGSFVPPPLMLVPGHISTAAVKPPAMATASVPAPPTGGLTPMAPSASGGSQSEANAGERLSAGAEVAIGAYRFRCSSVLGRGSFSEVWAGDTIGGPVAFARQEVAVKDICCANELELQQALWEADLLEQLRGPESMRIPSYLAHCVDHCSGGGAIARVRVAMTRAPGEPLDNFLRRRSPPGVDAPNAVRLGCALSGQLIRQLGPTLQRVSRRAWHRDVNSHNILVSDALDGGVMASCSDPDEAMRRASFWLIDFGLAVDVDTWPSQWPYADVAGDCRYWPPSSFLMSFYGPDETSTRKDLCNQYQTRLDIVGLGLTALEVLCSSALAARHTWGDEALRGSWRRLFLAWQKYRDEVTRWHTQIFQIFSCGGDIAPLYQQLAEERVVDRVSEHLACLRGLLRACTKRAEDKKIQNLLAVLAETIDERSTMGLGEMVEAVGGVDAVKSAAPAHSVMPVAMAVATPSYTQMAPLALPQQPLHTMSQHMAQQQQQQQQQQQRPQQALQPTRVVWRVAPAGRAASPNPDDHGASRQKGGAAAGVRAVPQHYYGGC